MAYNKGLHGSSGGSHRGRSYVLILLITFGAALLGVMVLHKLRERRIYNLLIKERDQQLLALQLLLQKERDRTNELRGKNEEMRGKIYSLRSQKTELARTVVEMKSTLDSLRDEQKVMESAFEENQNELRTMQEKGSKVEQGGSQIIALRENLKHKEAEIKDLKRRLETPFKKHPSSINDHSPIVPEIVTVNGTMAAQDKTESENKENENLRESASVKYDGDDKFQDEEVTDEIKDETRTDQELGKKNEEPRDDGGGAGVAAAKDIEDEVVDGRENKAIREEELAQLVNNTDGEGKDVDVKQLAGVKRKHGHASRTKGKRWRTIVKNRLMENNGIFESYGKVNKGNRKVYRDEKGEKEDDDQRKDKPQAHLLKPQNHENRYVSNMRVNNTNHQETNNGINIYPENQRQVEHKLSEDHEDRFIQRNWSTKHINKEDKNADQIKPNMAQEEPEKLEVLDVQKQERDGIDRGNEDDDDDFKESQSEFEDEKDEYKEEIDESEFQPGL
ncbi:glutamic acid-rich protein-like [Abrus precatorius]|uniref:Glutamic acid-rich protein-like n=1 Tax=Abrus precatorius TaxID=3816 RepID=A0A8B8KNA6_ABRPR|nr:glutamic acid-rich protein-like [Abrus precatorius]